MSRALLILANQTVRDRAIAWIRKLPDGTRVTFQEAKRTNDQNARLWAMLTDIATQATLSGEKYKPDEWKCIFMHALDHEQQWLPKLEGSGKISVGFSSSKLSKREMSDLMELIAAWGAQHGVKFNDGGSNETIR